jgi:hypothetical protein
MDPAPRAQALRMIEAHKTKQTRSKVSLGNEELMTEVLESVSRLIAAHHNQEMGRTSQQEFV